MNHVGITEDDRARIVAWAKRYPQIRAIYLFGSRATGRHRPDSDIDLAIEMPKAQYFKWVKIYRERQDFPLDYCLDAEWYEPGADMEVVGPAVKREGIILYERGALATG